MLPTRPGSPWWTIAGSLLAVLFVFSSIGCAELVEDSPLDEGFHTEGWQDVSSAEFHGLAVKTSAEGVNACSRCHGGDFMGGANQNGSCFTCHESYPHSVNEGWLDPESPMSHGMAVLAAAEKAEACASCHGTDFQGGPNENGSCYTCHENYPHDPVFAAATADGGHAAYIREVETWDLAICQTCHGGDFAGRAVDDKSCLTCHSEPEGPASCATCHGTTPDGMPPPDLLGHSDPSLLSVGAHDSHMDAGVACITCHVVPTTWTEDGHLGGEFPARAEVVFGGISSQGGLLTPTYDSATGTCGSTYCHGGFQFAKSESSQPFMYSEDFMVGNNVSLEWNDVTGDAVTCGSCHGLPPTGHQNFGLPCSSCHPSVVNENNEIIAPELHINGEINLR